ncbi:kinase-like domain-containing protein, partial [Blyttiomyces helicus]
YRAPEILLGSTLYACPMDMWSVGCIFAEMCTLSPLFPGDSEIDEIFRIFRILGTPTPEDWPGIQELRDWKPTFPTWAPVGLKTKVPTLGNDGIDLLEKLLTYDPATRISAKRALEHPYFQGMDD